MGIARMENMKEPGRVGPRALIYFELLSTFALGDALVTGPTLTNVNDLRAILVA